MKRAVIVAPTYNEEASIGNFLQKVFVEQRRIPEYQLHVVVSDSQSKDGTAKVVQRESKRNTHIHLLISTKPGPGRLGWGLYEGLEYAVNKLKADVLVTMEADMSNNPNQLPAFLKSLDSADIVIGSRYAPGGKIMNWSWWRKGFSLGANYILKFLVWTNKTNEFTNLYRAFKKDVWLSLRSKVKIHQDWIFVPAFAFNALNSKFTLIEQPIIYYDRFGGRSKMRTLSYTKNLLRYALRYRLKKYGTLS